MVDRVCESGETSLSNTSRPKNPTALPRFVMFSKIDRGRQDGRRNRRSVSGACSPSLNVRLPPEPRSGDRQQYVVAVPLSPFHIRLTSGSSVRSDHTVLSWIGLVARARCRRCRSGPMNSCNPNTVKPSSRNRRLHTARLAALWASRCTWRNAGRGPLRRDSRFGLSGLHIPFPIAFICSGQRYASDALGAAPGAVFEVASACGCSAHSPYDFLVIT